MGLLLPNGNDALRLEVDGLCYALDQAPTEPGRKVALTAAPTERDEPPFVDVVALHVFKARANLAKALAVRFDRSLGEILGHLALLLDQVERATAQCREETVELSPERREAALDLLRDPALLDRVAQALDDLGYVGEPATKRLCYLVATSRLLRRPLSAILMAPSGAGKSNLLDKLLLLLPPEGVEFLSRLTPSALYYAGPNALRHRLVVVDEQAGASDADYAIRTLQTKGYLRQAVPVGGRTEHFEAHGPIALLSGTTSNTLDPENLSRCLELALDDSPEQTRRIQAAQRRAWAGQLQTREVNTLLWQDAQRALEASPVVIPFAERLSYPARTTRDRREQEKLLGLVAAHALLHQRQRSRDSHDRVVAAVEDYAAVYGLLTQSLGHCQDGLSPRAARVYRLLAKSSGALTRREIAEAIGWNYMTSVRALDELMEQELVEATEKRPPRRYQTLGTTASLGTYGLTPPSALTAFTGQSLPQTALAPELPASAHSHSLEPEEHASALSAGSVGASSAQRGSDSQPGRQA